MSLCDEREYIGGAHAIAPLATNECKRARGNGRYSGNLKEQQVPAGTQ
jgi:hypothetical protein